MFKKLLTTFALAFAMLSATAQQPQTSDLPPLTPPFNVDATTTNGVAPGYKPSAAATGLTLNLSAGTANCSGIHTYAGGTLYMTDNSTNYVYLDSTASCIPAVSTSNFATGQIPVAVVVTSGGNITSITDDRTMFFVGTGGGAGGTGIQMQYIPQAPGQYALVFPQSCSHTGTGSACGNGGFTLGITNGDITAGVSDFSLPSYINPANVTDVYVSVISSATGGNGYPELVAFNLSNEGGGTVACSTFGAGVPAWTSYQASCHFTVLPTSYSAIAVSAELVGTIANYAGGLNVAFAALEVHYTGTAPPASTALQIVPPLLYNPVANTLGIGPYWPQSIQTATLAAGSFQLPAASGANIGEAYLITDSAAANCTNAGGGSTFGFCTSTGTGYTWQGLGGSSSARQWSCQPGIGDGFDAIVSNTYLQTTCQNTTGFTITLSGISCYTDNSGSSTMNVTNGGGTDLLTGPITCGPSFVAGTQSATNTLANGDYLKFTFAADGTSKQSTWVVGGSY
jgi:hypothetical protein